MLVKTKTEISKYVYYEYERDRGYELTVFRNGSSGGVTRSDTPYRRDEKRLTYNSELMYPPTHLNFSAEASHEALSTAASQAYSRLADKLANTRNELGMAFATSKQTYQMAKSISERLWHGYKDLRRGDISGMFTNLLGSKANQRYLMFKNRYSKGVHRAVMADEAAQNWLMYQYGISPLVSEVNVLRQKLMHDLAPKSIRRRVRGSATGYDVISDDTVLERFRVNRKVKVSYLADVSMTSQTLATLESYGLLNPWVVINEITPYSFVLNWFTNHEAWMRDSTALYGWDIDKAITSTKHTAQLHWSSTTAKWFINGDAWTYIRHLGIEQPSLEEYSRAAKGITLLRGANASAIAVTAAAGHMHIGQQKIDRARAFHRPRYVSWKLHKYHNHKI